VTAVSAPTSHGHPDQAGLPPPSTVEVADGVFAYVQPDGSWWINNTGFVVGADSVVAVDACSTERRTRGFLDAIARVTGAPVRTLVNTHHHGDHTNGNCLFGPVTIVSHADARSGVLDQRIGGLDAVFGPVPWGELEIAPPTLTFHDQVTLWSGETEVRLIHLGTPAHTVGDVVAWLPGAGVLFSGDLVFNGGTPFVLMGSVSGSLQTIATLRQLEPTTIVPGHGGVCGPAALDGVEAYLRFVSDLAIDARAAGLTPLEAARQADLGPFAEWLDAERLVGNLHRAYSELDGDERGAPVDIVAAFADMIAFNGGAPLRCLA